MVFYDKSLMILEALFLNKEDPRDTKKNLSNQSTTLNPSKLLTTEYTVQFSSVQLLSRVQLFATP